jgi:spermidine/putrescine transport system permease protein
MKRSFALTLAASALIYLFLYMPIAVVIAGSFNQNAHGAIWRGFTLEWYPALFQDELAGTALRHSLLVAFASSAVSTLLGSMLGYGLSKHSFRGKTIVSRLLYLPFCLPDIVLGVSLMLFFFVARKLVSSLELGLFTMILAHVTFQIPFVAMVARARAAGLDPLLEAAASDLGAARWQRFRWVTLPLLLPGIVAGGLLAFTLSLDDFVVSFFTSGAGSVTVPILIYSSVKRGITPEINALSTLLIAASALGTIAITLLQMKLAVEKRAESR